MIINSLTLENFKSHKNTKLNFNENISLILGSNGAGKSSILEAISYSLFKDFTGTIDSLIRKPAEEEDFVKQMSVTIEFSHNNINYRLKRGKKGNKTIAELRYLENDRYVLKCNGDKTVTKDIESILELDSKSFLNAVYIRQGDITDLIEKTAADKKELISKLLNIDSFETAWKEIKELKRIYEDKFTQNEGILEDKERIEEDNVNIQENIDHNKKILEEEGKEAEELDKLVKQEEVEVTRLQTEKTKYESLVDKKKIITEILQKNINNKKENEEKLKNIEAHEEEIKKLEKETKKLPALEELIEIKTEIDTNNTKIKELSEEITDIDKNTQLKENTKEAHENIEKINNELKELKIKKEKINEEYSEYKSIEAQINEKKSNLNAIKEDIQQASQNATDLFNDYFNSPESIESKTIFEKEKTEKEIKELHNTINVNSSQISVLENNLKTTKKSLKELELTEDTCPICQSEISHEKHEELSNKYNEDISKYSSQLEDLKKSNKINELKLDEKDLYLNKINKISIDVLKKKNDEFENLNNEIKEFKQKIPEDYDGKKLLENIESEINEKENILKNLQEEDQKYFFAVNRLKELGDKTDLTKKIDELNKNNQNKTNKCREIIQKYAVRDNLTLQIKNLKEQEKKLNNLIGQIQDKESVTNKIKEMSDEISINEKTLNDISSDIENINFDEKIFETVNDTYTQNKKILDEKKINIIKLETEIKKDEESITKNNRELKELEDIALEQKNLTDYLQLLDTLRDIYSKDGVQKDLRDNVRPLIEKETLDIFNEFDFDYSGIKLDEDYNITIYHKNEELDSKIISGGEKIVIALSLRLGIAKVLSENKTDLLILDEPTIHLDEERRKSLIDIIREINFVPQMIVVTHDDEMESLSSNIIKIVKQNGISSIDDS